MSESAMTLEQAEEIWMAHQLGMHPGPQSEVAMALLVLANNEEEGVSGALFPKKGTVCDG